MANILLIKTSCYGLKEQLSVNYQDQIATNVIWNCSWKDSDLLGYGRSQSKGLKVMNDYLACFFISFHNVDEYESINTDLRVRNTYHIIFIDRLMSAYNHLLFLIFFNAKCNARQLTFLVDCQFTLCLKQETVQSTLTDGCRDKMS